MPSPSLEDFIHYAESYGVLTFESTPLESLRFSSSTLDFPFAAMSFSKGGGAIISSIAVGMSSAQPIPWH
jgi:hypothetical protein